MQLRQEEDFNERRCRPAGDPTARRWRSARPLGGGRIGLRSSLLFAGPAVIASIAYMDPGNFATNVQAE
jgi:manganese transport protein